MLKMLVLSAALVAASVVQAQAPAAAPATPATSAAKKELVAKVLKLQQPGIEAMGSLLIEQPLQQLMQGAGQALQRVPAERREALAADLRADAKALFEEAAPLARSRAVAVAPSTIGKTLEENFTEEELTQIIALLQSPANRKFQQAFPEMQRALTERVAGELRGELGPKFQALDQKMARRLGIAPPTPAASAPRPAPAKKP